MNNSDGRWLFKLVMLSLLFLLSNMLSPIRKHRRGRGKGEREMKGTHVEC